MAPRQRCVMQVPARRLEAAGRGAYSALGHRGRQLTEVANG